ncbi:hypothetical protein TraAM80_01832 [Trypanosoma rangeli]|uniref:NAD-dependent epimerase/dehydratase domain-containing protein n=1 Tax=Trypanosoma rangeli TaxID=5698 RepID=A0A422NX27_TRYRA|nr:uncharacterized protein TraAM80_01832 [Trypanosoma rangeli]RNF10083.1 hypothetical protein TraAM80_01832 [Trypanosoma rangeli]|eukprot:RNF10083.1 hypothetical protein TraAM80_01832 [Trypanosoma rangeli]
MASRKLLLLGGTGFVGTHVLRKALQRGWKVICASRGGLPPVGSPLLDEAVLRHHHPPERNPTDAAEGIAGDITTFHSPLEFVSLDATSRSQVFHFLEDHPDATAVVSCIGHLSRDHVEARRICGDANINIAAAVYERGQGVRRVVLVSAAPLHEFLPLLSSRWLLKGYFYGKKIAERAVLENLGDRAVVLCPSFIHGTRYVQMGEGFIPLPLWLLGRPLEAALRPLHRDGLLLPPVDVDVVAEVVARAIEGQAPVGVLDYYKMQELCREQPPQDTSEIKQN